MAVSIVFIVFRYIRANFMMKYLAMNQIKLRHLLGCSLAGCLAAIALPSNAQLSNSIQTSNPAPSQAPALPTTNSPAQAQSGFSCDTSGEAPTTIYQSSQGAPEPWIQWVSDHFSGSGWSPDARCQEVSNRLETYRRNRKLRYVTLGTINNQSVICVASKDQGPCEGIIYTLKPGQDGIKALNNLFAWRKGGEGLESSYESVTAIPYIDVGSKLDESEVAPAAQPQPKTTTPENNSPEQHSPETHREL